MLSYFWVVQLADGTAVSQFHPETGGEIPFRVVEKIEKPIVKVGWYPFPNELRMKLANRGVMTRGLPGSAKQEINLRIGDELIIKREGRLKIKVRDNGGPVRETYYIIGKRWGNNVKVYVLDETGRRVQPGEVR